MFENKIFLITGGTGSFGNAVLNKLLSLKLKEIRIMSRDEKKQDDMRKRFNNPKLKFYLGDVRDKDSVINAVQGVDFIFHAAALKQVPSCEFFPLEAVKTNIIGTENVLNSAIECSVSKVVCLSTDKAVYPINAMGMSKALMEKIVYANSMKNSKTVITVTRYGNVMGSRGSVIPLFLDQIKNSIPITVTNGDMTRFMMSIDEAVELVFFAFKKGKSGEIFVQKSPAASVNKIVQALLKINKISNYNIKQIGTRHGEKIYEVLLSNEEMYKAKDLGKYFCIPPDKRSLNYSSYFEKGKKIKSSNEYTSHNTTQLNIDELIEIFNRINLLNKLEDF